MILRKQLSSGAVLVLFVVFATQPLAANMRAPVHVERLAGELRGAAPAKIRVLSEVIEFHCPEAYTGRPDFKAFALRVCQARVRYKISTAEREIVKLVFVYSGSGEVVWSYGGQQLKSSASASRNAGKKVCTYCPDDMKQVQFAEQLIEFAAGTTELEITYAQPLSYDESGHSYFSAGKWQQGFTYELWPIAEWQWAPDFHAELKFSVSARSGFLGIGYKDDVLKCSVEENGKFSDVALTVAQIAGDRRTATARVELKKRPQRLFCSYSAD